MVQAYTQFVAGFECGSLVWLAWSLIAYLYTKVVEGPITKVTYGATEKRSEYKVTRETDTVEAELEAIPMSIVLVRATPMSIVLVHAVPMSIVPISFFKSLHELTRTVAATAPQGIVTSTGETRDGARADLDIAVDFWTGERQLQTKALDKQHSLMVFEAGLMGTNQCSAGSSHPSSELSVEEEFLDDVTIRIIDSWIDQELLQTATVEMEHSTQVSEEELITEQVPTSTCNGGNQVLARLQARIQMLSIQQKKELAKQLTRTQYRILRYGGMRDKALFDELTMFDRLNYIMENIDIDSVLADLAVKKKKKKKKAAATLVQ